MGDSSLRIGIVGTGVIAWAHALALRGLNRAGLVDTELALVHDADGARAEGFAARHGARVAGSIDQVAAGVDAVYVCTSTRGHLPAVEAAARYGRPVFCEKPLARSLHESLQLASVIEQAGVPAQVGLVLRTAPIFRHLAALVSSGELGRPLAAVFRDDQYFPIQGHYGSTWRGDVTEAGAGALLEHSIHDVDILRACFGPVRSVAAATANTAGHPGIEDTVVATMTVGEVPVSLVSVWHQILSRGSTRRVEVFFETALALLEDDFDGPISIQASTATELRTSRRPGWLADVPVPAGEVGIGVLPYVEENRAFVDAVVNKTAPWPGLAEALTAHRVVDACYRSAAEGGTAISGEW